MMMDHKKNLIEDNKQEVNDDDESQKEFDEIIDNTKKNLIEDNKQEVSDDDELQKELVKIEEELNNQTYYVNNNNRYNETNPMYGIYRCFTNKKDLILHSDKLHIDKYSNNLDELIEESKKNQRLRINTNESHEYELKKLEHEYKLKNLEHEYELKKLEREYEYELKNLEREHELKNLEHEYEYELKKLEHEHEYELKNLEYEHEFKKLTTINNKHKKYEL
jgi:hypothetical protein